MSATNYARRGGGKVNGRVVPLEIRFFTEQMEVPPAMRLAPWVWWAVPRDYDEVRLVGEGKGERCVRLGHAPRECDACRSWRPRMGGDA